MMPTCVRALLCIVMSATLCFADLPQPAPGGWDVGPGWAATYSFADSTRYGYLDRWYDGELEFNGRKVFAISEEYYGDQLITSRAYYTWDAEGDLCFVGLTTSARPDGMFFEPPLKTVDYPLTVGKTWTSQALRYSDSSFAGEAVPEHHRFTVEASDELDLPAAALAGGDNRAYRIVSHPLQGDHLGTDWHRPVQGLTRFTIGESGPVMQLRAATDAGALALPGVGDPVALKFAWSSGQTIGVEQFTMVAEATGDGPGQELRGAPSDTAYAFTTFELTVDRLPTGLLIRQGPLAFPGQTGLTDGATALRQVDHLRPDFLVDRTGRFQGGTRLQAFTDSLTAILREQAGPDSTAVTNLMADLLTPAYLEASAAQDWNVIAGLWVGFVGQTRVLLEGESFAPHPLLPEVELPMRFRVAAMERCPCTESSPMDDCVRMIYSATTAPEAIRLATRAISDRFPVLAGQHPSYVVESVHTSVMAVLEPATLLPHQVNYEKRVTLRGTGPDSLRIRARDDFKTLTFRYGP